MATRMTSNDHSEQPAGRHALKRRGLIAGAAALVASTALLRKSEAVAATDLNSGILYKAMDPFSDNFVLWSAASTLPPGYNVIGIRGTGKGTLYGVHGIGGENNAIGVQGEGTGTAQGVVGFGGSGGSGGVGVQGRGGAPNGHGMRGDGQGAGAGVIGGGGNNGAGVAGFGFGTGPGVYGESGTAAQGIGVHGQHTSNGYGVYGAAGDGGYGVTGVATTAIGVLGQSTSNVGVQGQSTSGIGVQGQCSSGSQSVGVYGHHARNGYGVYGDAGDGGYGVTGVATTSIGVLGQSTSGTGVFGSIPGGSAPGTIAISGNNAATAANSHGIVGVATVGHGLVGATNYTPPAGGGPPYYAGLVGNAPHGAYAGLFFGNVQVAGTLNGHAAIVQHANLAVAHPDGSHRLANSIGAVESWLEDVGEGTLTNGQATIAIDREFAAIADTGKYHVFLTAHGDYNLHVAEMKADGFVVRVTSAGGGTQPAGGAPVGVSQVAKVSSVAGTFSWKVMAKRKDAQPQRLATYTFPKLETPHIPVPPNVAVRTTETNIPVPPTVGAPPVLSKTP